MSKKKLNKVLNKIIFVLIIFIFLAYGKQILLDKKPINIKEDINIKDKNNSDKDETKENNKDNKKLEIYFFDVGQADSILINEENSTVLIDAGNNKDGKNLVEYLKNDLKLEKINIVIGTHPHEDHIGGLDEVINNFDIDKVYLPDVITITKTFEDVLNSIEKKKYKIIIPKINEEFKLNNMNFKILYTGTDEKNLNDSSIVLKLKYDNTSYLFMGDASKKTEKKLLKKDITSDVIKIGHHGSEYSTSEDFLNKVNPKYAIIQVGKNNIYKHPNKETLEKLNKNNIKIYRTDINGTIKIISDGKNISFKTINTKIDG